MSKNQKSEDKQEEILRKTTRSYQISSRSEGERDEGSEGDKEMRDLQQREIRVRETKLTRWW